MRAQLEHVLELASLQNVAMLQVIPFGAGAHPAMGRPFVILVFPGGSTDGSPLEDLTSAFYLEDTDEVTGTTCSSTTCGPLPVLTTRRADHPR
jgi:hypothetical protein